MKSSSCNKLLLVTAIIVFVGIDAAYPDEFNSTIHLKNGSNITGTIVSQSTEDKRDYVVIRTQSGSFLKLDKSKTIKRIVSNDSYVKAYDIAVAKMENTADGHLQMHDWCKANGDKSKYNQQMKYHLKQIVKLDPSDERAWQKLNFIKRGDGNWIPEEQHYRSLGYVKVKGRWTPSVQVEYDRKASSSGDHLNSRKKALKLWHKNVLPNESRDNIRAELFPLVDSVSVGYFENRYLRKESNVDVRLMYIEAIGQVESGLAQSILVKYAIADESFDVREQALLMLEQKHYDSKSTVNRMATHLKNPANKIVNRAGRAIGYFKEKSGIVPLIESLKTTHDVATGDDPGRMNAQFGNNGTGFSTGGPKSVKVSVENEAVLQALRDITGQNNGFDSDLWKRWYISEHTVTDYDLRNSESK